MKISLISFTGNGSILCKKLTDKLAKTEDTKGFAIKKFASQNDLLQLDMSLSEWTKQSFENDDAIIFIGACGIAVRSIAPFVKSKTLDPAVIVIDEKGKFVISLLSGHIGGSNELSLKISDILNAVPVITTATDVNNTFAVDVFATHNNMFINNMKAAKAISAAVLEHRFVGLDSEFKIKGELPNALTLSKSGEIGICICLDKNKNLFKKTLHLIPKAAVLGIGCRRGKEESAIKDHVLKVLQDNNIAIEAVEKVVTIDLKKDEAGLIGFCGEYNLDFKCYSSQELLKVTGEFTESEFVKKITGVDNVCERSAILGSDNGQLIVKKTAANGVTVAVALKEWSVQFE